MNGHAHRFSLLRMLVWLVVLVGLLGIVQYLDHAWQVLGYLRAPQTASGAHARLRGMLYWDIAYLAVASLVVIAACGTLLGKALACRVLRGLAALLAVWALLTAVQQFAAWQAFRHNNDALASLASANADAHALMQRATRTFVVGIALKVVAIVLLAWLAWRLRPPKGK